MRNSLFIFLVFCLPNLYLFADTYVWEDYDDFSGSSLDTNKWDVGYFEGGQNAVVSGGKAELIGTGFTGSDDALTPAPWVGAVTNSIGQSNSGIFLKSDNVNGLEVEVTIPTSGNSENVGFIIETYSEELSTYNGIELAWRQNSLSWSFENEYPSSGQLYEIDRAANLDETYNVAVIHTGSRMELHINGERVANLNSTFSPAHWLIGSFNDDGNPFSVSIDNVRVLRPSSETLNDSGLFLDSDDPVSLTLEFENNLITSTFEDNGGPDSGTESGIAYDYIISDESIFSITFTDTIVGDYLTFDRSTNRGKLYDFKDDGQIDTSGTWEFTFQTMVDDLAVRPRSIWASRDLVYLQTPSGPNEIDGAGEIDFWAELTDHPPVTHLNLSVNGNSYDLRQQEAPNGFRTRFEYGSGYGELFDLESASDSDWSPYINATTFTFSMTVNGAQYSYAHNLPVESELPQPPNVSVNVDYSWKKDTEGNDYVEILESASYQFSWDSFTTTDPRDYIVVYLQEIVGNDDEQIMPEVILDANATSYVVDGSYFDLGKKYSFYVELMNVTEQENPSGFTHASGTDESLPLLQTTARMVTVLDIVVTWAPSLLTGKTIFISEEGFESNYYFNSDEAYFLDPIEQKLFSTPYTYTQNSSTQATLTLDTASPDVTHQITFSSPNNATSNWSDTEDGNGSATLEVLDQSFVPNSLVGWTYKSPSMDDTIQFFDSSNAIFYNASDSIFSNRELSQITYTFEQLGPRIAKFSTSLDEETLLFFDSGTSGYFDWEETGGEDGQSGQFYLYYYTSGHALDSLAGSSITIGENTYIFTSNNSVTVHSPNDETASHEYSYLRENEDEALLSVESTLYKLDFYNHQYGRIIEGGSGYFSIHQNWATKGWVYYDDLPWIYSNNQGDWMYQVLSDNNSTNTTELMYFEPWSNLWSQNLDLNFTDQRVFSADSEFYWEDYDDFNGTELNSSKWGTMYLGGGIEPYVSGGKLVLSAGSGNPSATKVVKSGWEDIFQGDEGGESWVYAKESSLYGIEAEFVIPNSASPASCFQLGVLSLNPLSALTAELNADPSSSGQYSQGLAFYHSLSPDFESEQFDITQRDIIHRLGTTFIDGRLKLFVDGEVKYEADSETFNTDMFFINGFNDDYNSNGLPFVLNADNARVLRKKTFPKGWMWTEYYPWAYSYETGGWLYFELAKDTDGNPVMNYYDHSTGSWDLYGPSLNQLTER